MWSRGRFTTAGAVALALIPAATAQAQTPPPNLYGGGALPRAVPRIVRTAALDSMAIGLGVSPARDAVGIRLSIGAACARVRGGYATDDFVVRTALRPDGSFAVQRRVRSDELRGRMTVTVSGAVGADRADGIARVAGGRRCDSGAHAWSARPVNLAAPPTGEPAPQPGVLLFGITDQPGDVPHGVAVRVTADGRRAFGRMSVDMGCGYDEAGGPGEYDQDVQQIIREHPLDAGWVVHGDATETAAERRRHMDYLNRFRLDARFAGPAVVGTLSWFSRYQDRAYRERCAAGPFGFVAVP